MILGIVISDDKEVHQLSIYQKSQMTLLSQVCRQHYILLLLYVKM